MKIARSTLLAFLFTFLISPLQAADIPLPPAPAWKDLPKQPLSLGEHPGFVMTPKTAAPGKPWVWRTSFPAYHPEVDIALLEKGFHIAHLDVVAMLGSEPALDLMDQFYERVRQDFGLAEKPALEAVSRGGLHAYRYAARHPERIACILADVPVLCLASWPLKANAGKPVLDALHFYGFPSEDALRAFRGNPIDLLEPLAKAKIPLRHLISLSDRVVPPEENTLEAQRRLRTLGSDMEVVVIRDPKERLQGHHFTVPPEEIERSISFILKHASP
ncbi:MAG: hypothetical protein RLZZ142_1567 [Verrucomicrobiota bacterium]|jgi:pimeloyl-ACP methyl ester carboxylesterase